LAAAIERPLGAPGEAVAGELGAEPRSDTLEHVERRAMNEDRPAARPHAICRAGFHNGHGTSQRTYGERSGQADGARANDDDVALSARRVYSFHVDPTTAGSLFEGRRSSKRSVVRHQRSPPMRPTSFRTSGRGRVPSSAASSTWMRITRPMTRPLLCTPPSPSSTTCRTRHSNEAGDAFTRFGVMTSQSAASMPSVSHSFTSGANSALVALASRARSSVTTDTANSPVSRMLRSVSLLTPWRLPGPTPMVGGANENALKNENGARFGRPSWLIV